MRALRAAMAAALAVIGLAGGFASAQQSSITGIATVIDGDTIEIHGQSVRLSGFDAPERGKMCGRINVYQRASLALSDITQGRTVSCASRGTDSYGRIVAVCSVGALDLGDFMVSLGWARDWPRYSGGAYAAAEEEARRNRLGVWGLTCPADVWSNRDYTAAAVSGPAAAMSSTAIAPPSSVAQIERAYVSASALNVRAAPGAGAALRGRLQRAAPIEVLERREDWARIAFDGDGDAWVHSDYISSSPPPQRMAASEDIRRLIMERSIASYSGSCPCPYNYDRAGRQCGRRSAYSRPGGASPICYPSDVTDADIEAFRARRTN